MEEKNEPQIYNIHDLKERPILKTVAHLERIEYDIDSPSFVQACDKLGFQPD
jgi:hypothetical protein